MNPALEFRNIPNDSIPFEGMKISDNWKCLSSVDNRTTCPKCCRSRKYFCYNCYVPVADIQEYVPKVKVSIIFMYVQR